MDIERAWVRFYVTLAAVAVLSLLAGLAGVELGAER